VWDAGIDKQLMASRRSRTEHQGEVRQSILACSRLFRSLHSLLRLNTARTASQPGADAIFPRKSLRKGARLTIATALPGFLRIDHIGVAVVPGDLEAQVLLYKTLGFAEIHREDIAGPDQVREVFLQPRDGNPAVQLLEPLHASSPVARYIEKNSGRGGMVHLAFRVADIHAAFRAMQADGFAILDAAPRSGSRGTQVFFVHPKTTHRTSLGFLLEVVQHSQD
jgi:methylmalonyl-CoA/ethylmalonyl-CoA epimerase